MAGGMIDEIVVTGSRLVRQDFTAISPSATIDSDIIRNSGNATLEETLNMYPQSNPDTTSASNQSGGDGVLAPDLRGLGSVRTLVLVNGKRFIPASATGQSGMAGVPDMLIDRVEIATSGASAVYSSDAIAGAVNFILMDDFQGTDIRCQWGEAGEGDAATNKVDVTLGTNTADGSGNVTFHASHTERSPVFMENRKFSQQPWLADSMGNLNEFGSGNIPGGKIFVPSADFHLINDVDLVGATATCPGPIQDIRFGENSQPLPFCRPTDQFNYAATNYIMRPLERWQMSVLGNYDIAENIEVCTQAFHTKKEKRVATGRPGGGDQRGRGQRNTGAAQRGHQSAVPRTAQGILRRQPALLRPGRRRRFSGQRQWPPLPGIRPPQRPHPARVLRSDGRPARRHRTRQQRVGLGRFPPVSAFRCGSDPGRAAVPGADDIGPRRGGGRERHASVPDQPARLRAGQRLRHQYPDRRDGQLPERDQTTWRAGLDWAPIDWAHGRFSISRAIRAQNQSFIGGEDQCVIDNNPTQAVKDPCLQQGVRQRFVDDLQVGASQGWSQFSGGNLFLNQEKSDTHTVGFVVPPPALEGLTVSLDYWQIEVKGAISTVNSQALVNPCFQLLDKGSPQC